MPAGLAFLLSRTAQETHDQGKIGIRDEISLRHEDGLHHIMGPPRANSAALASIALRTLAQSPLAVLRNFSGISQDFRVSRLYQIPKRLPLARDRSRRSLSSRTEIRGWRAALRTGIVRLNRRGAARIAAVREYIPDQIRDG